MNTTATPQSTKQRYSAARARPLGGRPAIGPTIAAHVPRLLADRLDAGAAERGETRSAAIRRCLELGLDELATDNHTATEEER